MYWTVFYSFLSTQNVLASILWDATCSFLSTQNTVNITFGPTFFKISLISSVQKSSNDIFGLPKMKNHKNLSVHNDLNRYIGYSLEQRVSCDSFAREWERSSNFPCASCASSRSVLFHRKCDAISYEIIIKPRTDSTSTRGFLSHLLFIL